MSRELSKNERRLGVLALFCVFWGAFLLVLGGDVVPVAAAVVAVLGGAAVALEGRHAVLSIASRVRAALGGARDLGRSGGARALHTGRAACVSIAQVDWAGRCDLLRQRTEVAARGFRTCVKTMRGAAAAASTRAVQSRDTAGRRREALRLNEQAAALRQAGRTEEALLLCERGLRLFRRLGDARGEALTLNGIGLTLARAGDADAAAERYRAALSLLGALDDPHAEGRILANLGALHRGRGDEEEARAAWQDALERLEPGSPEHDRTAQQLRLAS